MTLIHRATIFMFTASLALAADLSVGTWKFNAEKSKVRKPEDWKGRVTVISNGPTPDSVVTKTGKTESSGPVFGKEVVVYYNGKEMPGAMPGTALISTKVNDHEWMQINKRGGKEYGHTKTTLSADLNTRTAEVHSTDAKGAPYDEVRVFDRVK